MILDRILADKRTEVESCKTAICQSKLEKIVASAPPPRDFASAVRAHRADGDRSRTTSIRLIAEVKKASPSRGVIRADFDPVKIATTYELSGASAISVLTDEKYFQGHLDYLKAVREVVDIPVLRKDFIIDPYQIYEARAAGADAVLLIVAALSRTELLELMGLAGRLGMATLVETHTAEELHIALEADAQVIGINNRNLRTFETTLDTTLRLAARVTGDKILVSESGIFTRSDVERLMQAGVDAILVGESLMREPDPGVKVKELLGNES